MFGRGTDFPPYRWARRSVPDPPIWGKIRPSIENLIQPDGGCTLVWMGLRFADLENRNSVGGVPWYAMLVTGKFLLYARPGSAPGPRHCMRSGLVRLRSGFDRVVSGPECGIPVSDEIGVL